MDVPSNIHLPPQMTSFIGRTDEILEIVQRLSESDCHLLTLVGPGGIGKTRLAIEVAKFLAEESTPADGVYFVDLQSLPTPDPLITTLADAINMRFFGEQPPQTQLLNHLRDRHLLLVIDNFEHLLDGVDLLTIIVKTAPGVKLLVTSREALNIQEEWLWQVSGLQMPDNGNIDNIEDYSAVRMFVERARHVRADFVLRGQEIEVAHICQLVDGMPLALELAAGWAKTLSCGEITNEIQQGLEFLTTKLRNVPERHRSIRVVFERSWKLLTDEERFVFPRLSVFRGGFRHEAAEAVAGASLSTLAGLVDKSLLRVYSPGRYDVQKLVQQYAEEQLDELPGSQDAVRNEHCAYYARFLRQSEIELNGPEQIAALDRIAQEIDNVRTAWEWAIERGKKLELDQSAPALFLYCQMRTKTTEGEQLFALAVKRFEYEESGLHCYLLLAWQWFCCHNGQGCPTDIIAKAFKLVSRFGVRQSAVLPLTVLCAGEEKHFERDELQQREALRQLYMDFLIRYQSQGELLGVAWMTYCMGQIFFYRQKYDEAEAYYKKSVEIFKNAGNRWGMCFPLGALGILSLETGNYAEGQYHLQEQCTLCQETGDINGIIYTYNIRATIAIKQRDFARAKLCLIPALKVELEFGCHLGVLRSLMGLCAEVLIQEGKIELAVELIGFLHHDAQRLAAYVIMQEIARDLDAFSTQLAPDVFQQAVNRGKLLDLKTVVLQLLKEFSSPSLQPDQPFPYPLSQRELEVLRLMAAGLKNREIAQKLVVAPGTVKAHTSAIYRKLDVTSRVQAIAHARELKLL